jgi:HSP20 family molecular chaperone IbpA
VEGKFIMVELKISPQFDNTKPAIADELKSNLTEWLEAKEDIFWRPPIELTEQDGEFTVKALIGGVALKDVEILASPELMLIKEDVRNAHERAVVYQSEFPHGKLRRSIELPKPINPKRVRAEIRDGMLTVTAEIAMARESMAPMLLAA